jgi:MFS family permease
VPVSFIVKNARFLGFGVAMAFLSSFGQTFFIGVYKDAITGEFALSNSDFGLYYLLITLVSAVGLNRLGHIIDRVSLTPYVAALIVAMAAACFAVGVAGSLWFLVIALMLVRLLGQGLLTHAAMTSMSRYYGKNRGLSVAVAGLGFPLGQAVLPVAAVMLMGGFAWRTGWLASAALLLLVALPAVLWLLKGQQNRHKQWHLDEAVGQQDLLSSPANHLRRKDVISEWRFYLMLPALIVGPFWITGVFFFPGEIAQFKGV